MTINFILAFFKNKHSGQKDFPTHPNVCFDNGIQTFQIIETYMGVFPSGFLTLSLAKVKPRRVKLEGLLNFSDSDVQKPSIQLMGIVLF